jgi:uncharacterized membrane protein YhiD involved in acid resistance
MRLHRFRIILIVLACTLMCVRPARAWDQGQSPEQQLTQPAQGGPPGDEVDWPRARHELWTAAIRLPLAAALGAALALRPKRKGTPRRTPPVVQTQIMLAVVGAVIMLVVGANLARAFGIVGAANLIRYRSKVDDPKDAVVMLCTLALGLASGSGLYLLATFSMLFMGVALWVIESVEPERRKHFEVAIKVDKGAEAMRTSVEKILTRYRIEHELRTLADDELSYSVDVPYELQTDQVSTAIAAVNGKEKITVEWDEKKPKDKAA